MSKKVVTCPQCGSEKMWKYYRALAYVRVNSNTDEEETEVYDVDDDEEFFQCEDCTDGDLGFK